MKEILVERKVTKVTDNTFLATLIENQKKEFDELVYTLITILFCEKLINMILLKNFGKCLKNFI